VAAIIAFVVGGLWYSPLLFGNLWMKLSGITQKQVEKAKKNGGMAGMWKSYLGMLLATIVTSYVVAYFVKALGASTATDGAMIGFWLWLCVAAPLQLNSVVWEGKPFKLYLLQTGHVLVELGIIGAIVAAWA